MIPQLKGPPADATLSLERRGSAAPPTVRCGAPPDDYLSMRKTESGIAA
jgi:hypothetical protein